VVNQRTCGVGDAEVRDGGSDDGVAANEGRHGGLEGGKEKAGKCHCVVLKKLDLTKTDFLGISLMLRFRVSVVRVRLRKKGLKKKNVLEGY